MTDIEETTASNESADWSTHDILPQARSRHGGGGLLIAAATFQDESGRHGLSVVQNETAVIRLRLVARRGIRPSAGLHLYDRLGNLVFAVGTKQLRKPLPGMRPGQQMDVTFHLTFSVQPGEYTLSLGCSDTPETESDICELEDQHEGLGPIAVHSLPGMARFYGIARLPIDVTFNPSGEV
jgi:lipopolysaccharide transport system ATP-binding protein